MASTPFRHRKPVLPVYEVGASVPTRLGYGQALVALGAARDDVVVLDAETGNSTHAELFGQAYPDRHFEMYIAEQIMVATATGLAARGWTPFASTIAAFATRAYDFVRMAAIGGTNLRLCGSHSGMSVGESGPSGMALEDIACFRAIPGAHVLQPSDATQAAYLTAASADLAGFTYLRTSRGAQPVLYPAGTAFPIGGSKSWYEGADDDVTLIGSGVTVHTALAARELLVQRGLRVRVLDCYSIKPIDAATLLRCARETSLLVSIDDHYLDGGVGSAIAEVLAGEDARAPLHRIGLTSVPGSGPVPALLASLGLDAAGVAATVAAVIAETPGS